jgi:hypothetical protein
VVTFAIAVFFDVSNLLRILLVSQPFVLASVWCRSRLYLHRSGVAFVCICIGLVSYSFVFASVWCRILFGIKSSPLNFAFSDFNFENF